MSAVTPFEALRTRGGSALELSQARGLTEPWLHPPATSLYFDAVATIALPAAGASAEAVSLDCPRGYAGVLREIVFEAQLDNPWRSGDGQITWSCTQNQPLSGGPLLTGYALPFLVAQKENRGSMQFGGWKLPGIGHRFEEFDTLRITVANVQGNTGLVTAALRGWFWPIR